MGKVYFLRLLTNISKNSPIVCPSVTQSNPPFPAIISQSAGWEYNSPRPGFSPSLFGDVPDRDVGGARDADLLQRFVECLDAFEIQLPSQSLLLQTLQKCVEETLCKRLRLDFLWEIR